MKRVALLGRLCGRLLVTGQLGIRQQQRLWLCVCTCTMENFVVRRTAQLTSTEYRQSCGCIAREENKFKPRLRPFEGLFNAFLRNCKKRGMANALAFEQFVKFSDIKACHYCEAAIDWKPHGSHGSKQYHLDRKDNAVGYAIDNCVVCCKRCNYLKGAKFTYEEWKAMAKAYYEVRRATHERIS